MTEILRNGIEDEPEYVRKSAAKTKNQLDAAKASGNSSELSRAIKSIFARGKSYTESPKHDTATRHIDRNTKNRINSSNFIEDRTRDTEGVDEDAHLQSRANLANLREAVQDGYLRDLINSDSVDLAEKKAALGVEGDVTQEQLLGIVTLIEKICLHMFDEEYRSAKNYLLMVGFIYRILRNPTWVKIGKPGDELTDFEEQYFDNSKKNPSFADWYFKALTEAAEANNGMIFGASRELLAHRFGLIKNKMARLLRKYNEVNPEIDRIHNEAQNFRPTESGTKSADGIVDDVSLMGDSHDLTRREFEPKNIDTVYDIDAKNIKSLRYEMFQDIQAASSNKNLGFESGKLALSKTEAITNENLIEYLIEARDMNGKYRIKAIRERLDKAKEKATTSQDIAAYTDLESAVFASHLIQSMGTAIRFKEFYKAYYDYHKSQFDPNNKDNAKLSTSKNLNADEYAAITTTKQMKSAMAYLNGLVFRSALIITEAPMEDFDHHISHGASNINAAQKYNKLHTLLENLKATVNTHDSASAHHDSHDEHTEGHEGDGHNKNSSPLYCVTELGGYTREHDPSLSRDKDSFSSATEYSFDHTSPASLVKELSNYLDTRKDLIRTGWNMQFLSTQTWHDRKGYFDSVAAVADQSLRASVIDRGNNMEDSALIEQVKCAAEQTLNQMFGEQNWSNLDRVAKIQKIFQYPTRGSLQVNLQRYMEEYYPEVSNKKRQEIIHLSLATLYGVRFREATHSSYAEPPETFGGQGTDIAGRAAVFDEWYNFRRWAMGAGKSGHDFAFKGAALCPADMMRLRERLIQLKEQMNPSDYIAEGWRIYKETKKNGRLAYLLSEHYVNIRKDADGNDTIVENMSHVSQKKNKFGQGGVEIIGASWRNKPYLRSNIPKEYLIDSLGGSNVGINLANHSEAYVMIWKSVENIGVNEIRAFSDDFAGAQATQNKNGEIVLGGDQGTANKELIKFLYERYFKEGQTGARMFTDTYTDAEDFYQKEVIHKLKGIKKMMDDDRLRRDHMKLNISETAHIEKDQEAFNKQVSNVLLKPLIYQAMTVATIERTPLELMYNTLKRDEQNGMSLVDQLKDAPGGYFDPASDLYKSMMFDHSHSNHTKEEAWNSMVNDIKFVQSKLRGLIDEEIETKRRSWTKLSWKGNKDGDGHQSNIYGDYTKLYSAVNDGKGYRIDPTSIKYILYRKDFPKGTLEEFNRLEADNPVRLRIERAVTFHTQLLKAAMSTNEKSKYENSIEYFRDEIVRKNGNQLLTEAQWNDIMTNGSPEEKAALSALGEQYAPPEGSKGNQATAAQERLISQYELYENRKQVRAKWFAKMWQEGFLGGRSFMADHSDKYILLSNTDQRVVARAAGDCYEASERLKTYRGDVFAEGSMLTMIKDVVRKGEDNWGTLKSLMTLNRKEFSNANGDPDTFMPVINADWTMILTMLCKNARARTFLGEYASWMNPTNNSIAGEAWTYWESHDFNAVNVKQFLYAMGKVGGMNPDAVDYFSKAFCSTWFDVAKELLPQGIVYMLTYAFVTWGVNGLNKLDK